MLSLDALPPEILFHILTFAEPACDPDPKLISIPLNTLAATNKQLNAIVEEYARSLLKQHGLVVPRKPSKTSASRTTCRRKWLGEVCQFCRKNSKRKAIFYPTLTCCHACDKEHFPKMTMTKAFEDYQLSKLDLFTPNPLHPTLPSLTTGCYSVMGGMAVMISEQHVFARRDHIHRLLGDKARNAMYMGRRKSAHIRIQQHLNMYLLNGIWTRAWYGELPESAPKSLKTQESRRAYLKKALDKEWSDMGVKRGGNSWDTAIEFD